MEGGQRKAADVVHGNTTSVPSLGCLLAPGWTAADLAVALRHRLLAAGVSEGPPYGLHTIKPGRIGGHPAQGSVVQRFCWSGPPRGAVHLLCHCVGTTVVDFRLVASDPQRCALASVQGPRAWRPRC
mgnify:FL=1